MICSKISILFCNWDFYSNRKTAYMIKYLCINQYVSLYINMPLFHFKDVVLNSRLFPSVKFPSSTYTNRLTCRQVSIKVNKFVGSQVYSKVLSFSNIKLMFIILVSKYRSSFSLKNYFCIFNTKAYVEESIM